ncbi:MAG: molybdate-binding protein, partial [Actinomycetota bacterium]|nr:molybdate-binding protein [Actinomycetota bacterium]
MISTGRRRTSTAVPALLWLPACLALALVVLPIVGLLTRTDLAKEGVVVVVCAPQVPCGAATEKVEQATGVTIKPVSE